MSLDLDLGTWKAALDAATGAVVEFFETMEERPKIQGSDTSRAGMTFDEPLPEKGIGLDALVEDIQERVFSTVTMTMAPGFFAYVTSGGNQAGAVAETVAGALSQNGAKWHLSPATVEIEQRVISWIAEFIGYHADTAGHIVSGGSMANQVGIMAARQAKAPWDMREMGLCGNSRMMLYCSDETHACVMKSAIVLGLGLESVCKIPTTATRQIDLDALITAIEQDMEAGHAPFCVVANAGTVNEGVVDPIGAMADICDQFNLWLHVDGAYGIPAASVESQKHLFDGLKRADSVAVVPHKWMYVPVEDGVALIRDREVLNRAFAMQPDYLKGGRNSKRYEPSDHGFELSRSFKALKVWCTFKAYGAEQLRKEIEANCDDVARLSEEIGRRETFELVGTPHLSIVNFRYRGTEPKKHEDEAWLNQLNTEIADSLEADGRMFLSPTVIQGKVTLRICNINHRNTFEHLLKALEVIEDIASCLI